MPFYTWLRPRTSDSPDRLAEKKRATEKLQALRQALDAHIASRPLADGVVLPTDSQRILRLATWNIREFDSNAFGARLDESMSYIAEIISHFDLVAVQEVREDLAALRKVMALLGSSWDFLATDVTEGSAGNRERMVFLFNRNKVWFRNVAGEVTLPSGQKVTNPLGERFQVAAGPLLGLPAGASLASPTGLKTKKSGGKTKLDEDVELALPANTTLTLPPGSSVVFGHGAALDFTADSAIELPSGPSPHLPEEAIVKLPNESIVGGPLQFARTPFIGSFQAGWLKINLCTVHIYYGSDDVGLGRRNEEIRRLTKFLAERAHSDSDSDADSYFVAIGDFNIVGRKHETMASLQTNDFEVPEALQNVPGSNVAKNKNYDQIAIWMGESSRRRTYTRIRPYRAGVFDFFETVFRTDEEGTYRPLMKKPNSDDFYAHYSQWRTHQMSDHLPMWIELQIDFSDDYLEVVEKEITSRLGD
jgi:endonuclease/exonuclease/phosphatase family metal-dependent hydrolase